MPTAIGELTYVSFPIEKFERTDDGDLMVYGKATDGSVDSDEQIVDPAWSAKALGQWLDSGGNVRVQHQALRDPAGKGLSVELDKDGDGGHWVKSLVVEPVAKRLVEKGVLTAYSIGVARPVIQRDPTGKARNGIVAGGVLAELSLVDRPANKQCRLTLAKSEAGEPAELSGELLGAENYLATEDDGGLLTKTGLAGVGPDEAHNPQGGSAPATAQNDPGGDNDPEEDEEEDTDAIKAVDAEGRGEYKAARKAWLEAEPGVKNVAGGTEYLAKRAEWRAWHVRGTEHGLDGTREGVELWLAKRAEAAEVDKESRSFPADRRRELAGQGKALPDGSYPIPDADALRRAAVLARSGHGNVSAARRLISRRAKELGVANPLDEDDKVKKAAAAPAGGKPEQDEVAEPDMEKTTMPPSDSDDDDSDDDSDDAMPGKAAGGSGFPGADGDGGDPQMGAGKPKAPKKTRKPKAAAKALDEMAASLAKHVADGVITAEQAASVLTQAAEAVSKTVRPLPADTRPVGEHREPDGSTGVEVLEHQAGMPTDKDPVPDKIPPSVAALQCKEEDPPYAVGRMHDLLCAAFDPAGALAAYPALKTLPDGVDVTWFSGQAAEVAAAGKAEEAAHLAGLVAAAAALKDMDPAALADGQALLRKAFTDMYPNEHMSPSDPRRPGQFQRPYLAPGHASPDAGHKGSPNIPPPTHVPEPEDYHRPLITEGHEADSPANGEGNMRAKPATNMARTYYTTAARDQARTALAAMHDHIAASFPDLCPMAPSKSVAPPDMGARNVPTLATVASQGGVATVEKSDPAARAYKQLRKALRRTAAEALVAAPVQPPPPPPAVKAPLGAEELKAILAQQLTPLIERYETQIADLQKQVNDLGAQPDPALSPVRGSLAAATKAAAAPVERRSLVEEAAAKAQSRALGEEMLYRTYVQQRAQSSDPGVREKALAVLDKIGEQAVMAK